jgi:TM2 domain-containing membrane protein YozV
MDFRVCETEPRARLQRISSSSVTAVLQSSRRRLQTRQEMHVTQQFDTPAWSDQQRATFYYQMAAAQKDEVMGVLLALFLGSFGLHHFYLKQNGLGILYLALFWTGIPGLLGFLEAFFMPGRVNQYNAQQAAYIAASLGPAQSSSSSVGSAIARTCPACNAILSPGSKFCSHCGAAAS